MARTTNDPKCLQHARFASHLGRAHFDAIYWVLFVLVIFMLFAASWQYGRLVYACLLGLPLQFYLWCAHTKHQDTDPSTTSQTSRLVRQTTGAG